MRRSPGAAYWLALLDAGGPGKAAAKKVIHKWCIVESKPLADLFELPSSVLERDFSLSPDDAQALSVVGQTVSAQAQLIADLSQDDIGIITRDDIAYPDSLIQHLPEERLPYYIWFRGDLSILSHPIVSILGDTGPDAPSLESSASLATELVAAGYALAGGYGKGIDRAALQTAEREGGSIILILPMGIRQFARFMPPLEPAIAQGRVLVISPFAPDMGFTALAEEARLLLVTALAEALLLFEPQLAPAKLWPWSPDDDPGREAFVWGGSSQKALETWGHLVATPFEDPSDAAAKVAQLLGYQDATMASEEPYDAIPGVEPIIFDNSEQAIDLLSKTGNVPDSLRQRLADTDWTVDHFDEEQD